MRLSEKKGRFINVSSLQNPDFGIIGRREFFIADSAPRFWDCRHDKRDKRSQRMRIFSPALAFPWEQR